MYIDSELDEQLSSAVDVHLGDCAECAGLFEDFRTILESCREDDLVECLPPNPQALWCRIHNLIESEIERPEPIAGQQPEQPRGWFSKARSFTFSQIGSAVAGVAIISSLLTVAGFRYYSEPSADDFVTRSTATQTTVEKFFSKVGLTDTPQQAREKRLRQQQEAIEYWTRRVASRRAQWDARMRDAFDRNLLVIDESVNEYKELLKHNPEDELSGEMLDAVMDDKMKLLQAFSDL